LQVEPPLIGAVPIARLGAGVSRVLCPVRGAQAEHEEDEQEERRRASHPCVQSIALSSVFGSKSPQESGSFPLWSGPGGRPSKKSRPAPPVRMSISVSPNIRSSPSSPLSWSFPAPPCSSSGPAFPKSWSFPFAPLSLFAARFPRISSPFGLPTTSSTEVRFVFMSLLPVPVRVIVPARR